jgi:hypothetical protein
MFEKVFYIFFMFLAGGLAGYYSFIYFAENHAQFIISPILMACFVSNTFGALSFYLYPKLPVNKVA